MKAIATLTRSSRDQGTRPLFTEKAATSQYSQKAAHPTAKTSSTALILTHSPTHATWRLLRAHQADHTAYAPMLRR